MRTEVRAPIRAARYVSARKRSGFSTFFTFAERISP
jgi:hypothetical protein